MAKKSGKSNKSRFGNSAKAAAAEGAIANNVVSFGDAIARRSKAGLLPASMDRLVPAFKNWMAAAGVPAVEIDRLSRLLVNYFRNYTANVPAPDPTWLDVQLTGKILEDAGRFHPEMRVSVSLALNSYLKFLLTTKAWTGPYDDLLKLLGLTDEDILAPPSQDLGSYVYHEGSDPEEAGADRASRAYTRRAVALLEWIGDGRELTATGLLRRKDIAGAAACVQVDAIGSAHVELPPSGDGPARTVTSMAHVPRLMQYWHALIDTKLIKFGGKKVEPTKAGRAFARAPELALQKTAELAYCFFFDALMPYDDSQSLSPVEAALARRLAAAASSRPDIALPFEPDGADNPLGLHRWQANQIDRLHTGLAAAGLIDPGTDLVVPPSLRSALAHVLERVEELAAGAQDTP